MLYMAQCLHPDGFILNRLEAEVRGGGNPAGFAHLPLFACALHGVSDTSAVAYVYLFCTVYRCTNLPPPVVLEVIDPRARLDV